MLKRIYNEAFLRIKCFYGRCAYPIPKILDRVTTSELIANNEKLSLVRYGDGELGQILSTSDIGFQMYDKQLSVKLLEVLRSAEDPNILVCLPDLFAGMSNLKREPKQYWMAWINQNRRALSNILVPKRYGDALISRLYLPWIDISDEMKIVDNIKKTWLGKHVIVVEGAKTRWGVGNDLLEGASSVKRITCPSRNAFSKYDDILDACLRLGTKDGIFVLALGPTATVLAFDLAKQGYRALDLGHFDLQYEHLIRHAEKRMSISGKYNNELADAFQSGNDDYGYRRSIAIDLSEKCCLED